jgi:hypothetical protein
VGALAGCLENGTHEGDRRALAVGPGDVDHRRELALGMAERVQNAPHPTERKVYALGVQREQPRQDCVDLRHEPAGGPLRR